MSGFYDSAAGRKSLVDAFASALRGELPTVPPSVPPHLEDVEWKFTCECGTYWKSTASATVEQGKVTAPRQSCVVCRASVSGRPAAS